MKPFMANWRAKDEYPPPGCKDFNRLAWEFLRRNPDYAVHASQMAHLREKDCYDRIPYNSSLSLNGVECWPAAKRDESAVDYCVRMKIEKFKRRRIDRPSSSFWNRWGLLLPIDPNTPYDPKEIEFQAPTRLKRHEQLETRSFNLFLYPNQAAVRFQLDMPLGPQLEEATRLLRTAREDYAKTLKSSAHPERSDWPQAALPKSELRKDALQNAHFWLRCYDAERERKLPMEGQESRRKLKSGPTEQLILFNQERKSEGLETFEASTIKGFPKTANGMIKDKRYLMLITTESGGSRTSTGLGTVLSLRWPLP